MGSESSDNKPKKPKKPLTIDDILPEIHFPREDRLTAKDLALLRAPQKAESKDVLGKALEELEREEQEEEQKELRNSLLELRKTEIERRLAENRQALEALKKPNSVDKGLTPKKREEFRQLVQQIDPKMTSEEQKELFSRMRKLLSTED